MWKGPNEWTDGLSGEVGERPYGERRRAIGSNAATFRHFGRWPPGA